LSEAKGAPAAKDKDQSKRALLRLWLVLTACLGVLTFLIYRLFWHRLFTTVPCTPYEGCPLGAGLSAVASLVFASGTALLLAILLQNRGRYRQVFRISRARLIGAAALAALTPLGIFSGVPWILLPMLVFLIAAASSTGAGLGGMAIPMMAATLVIAITLAYPIACLLVSGLRNRFLRFAGFTLVWWSAYCLVLMLFGLRKFVL
jgi:hypothetical protein